MGKLVLHVRSIPHQPFQKFKLINEKYDEI